MFGNESSALNCYRTSSSSVLKRCKLLLLFVFLAFVTFFLLAYRTALPFSCDSLNHQPAEPTRTNFSDLAAAFLRIHDTAVNASDHRYRLVREEVHNRLIPFLIASRHPSPIYVIQVGANIGEEFKRGVSDDDPVVAAVVHPNARGILIEPVPSNFKLLVRNAAAFRNRFLCLNAAILIGNQSRGLPFYTVDASRVLAEFTNAPQWFTSQIGSFNKAHIVKHFTMLQSQWRPRNAIDYYIKEIHVKTLLPQNILDRLHSQYPHSRNAELSLLHVDAEGFDWLIAQAFLKQITPDVLVFEQLHMDPSAIPPVMRSLQSKGYFSWVSERNLYAMQVGLPRALGHKI